MHIKNAVVVDACRSPIGRGGRGLLVHRHITEIAVEVVKGLLARNPRVGPWVIEDLGVGNAAGLFAAGAKIIAREAGLPHEIAGNETNRQCGSSMDVVHQLSRAIRVGEIRAGIAVGVERMGGSLLAGFSSAEFTGKGEGPALDMGKLMAQNEIQTRMQPDHDKIYSVPFPDAILQSVPLQQMVQTAQNIVEVYDMPRAVLDDWAVRSHRKAGEATRSGRLREEIVPIETWRPVLDEQRNVEWAEKGERVTMIEDECIRPDATIEKLAKLEPVRGVFSLSSPPRELRITAGNSCPTNDGASAVLVMDECLAADLGLKPLARIVSSAVAGTKPQLMGLGPIPSSAKAMRVAGLIASDIGLAEVNEAFACQVIASIRDLGLDPERVNVNGGAIAIGHPLGCSGARLVGTLAHEMKHRREVRYGLATMCIGNGQGIATILERV